MFDFQSDLIFPVHAVPEPGPLPPNAERLSLSTSDGAKLAGVLIRAEQHNREKSLLLGFSARMRTPASFAPSLVESESRSAFGGNGPGSGTACTGKMRSDWKSNMNGTGALLCLAVSEASRTRQRMQPQWRA